MYGKPGLFLLMVAWFGLLPCPTVISADQPTTPPAAAPPARSVQDSGKPKFIRVAFTDFPPWSFKDSSGQQKGILVDYFHDLSESVGIPLKVETVPISRLHHFLSHGKLDLFVARIAEKGYDCCLPLDKVFDIETVIIGRKSGPTWTPSPSGDSSICRTGLSGYSIPGYRMFDANNLQTCARMVAGNRLEFMIGERFSLHKILSDQPPEIRNALANPVVWQKTELHLFISRQLDQSSAGPSLRKALSQLKESNYIARYMDSKF